MDEKQVDRRNRWVGGLVLIAVGILALFGQYFEVAWSAPLILLTIGGVFIIAGIISRQSGWFIPGGILAGIGMGVAATLWAVDDYSGEVAGGSFLLLFSLGWALIPILSIIFTDDRHLWALIPGGIIAMVGVGLIWGGMALDVLEFLGDIWPVFLILIGVYILFKRRKPEEIVEKQPEEHLEFK
jgi:hypothetical protein